MKSPRSPLFSRPRPALVLLTAALFLPGSGLLPGHAGEPTASTRLEDFLKRLGFEAIEFKWDDRHAVVQGELGGKKRSFLLDTGWAITTLDERAARELKTMGELNVNLDDSLAGRLSDPDIVLMEELTLGRAKFLNQPARRMKLKTSSSRWLHDGVLGFDFFYRHYCLLDCTDRRLHVRSAKPSEKVAETLAGSLRLSGMVEVPMKGKYGTTVEVEINGQSVKLAVDTGAFATVLDDSQVARLGLTKLKYSDPQTGSHLPENLQTLMVGAGKIGSETLFVSEPKSFRIASQQWKNVQVGVVNLVKWGLAKPGTRDEEMQGLLGAELLVHHGALIDFTSNRLWLRPVR